MGKTSHYYHLTSALEAESLSQLLSLLIEIHQRAGFNPDTITTPDGAVLNWNFILALRVVTGKASEDDYFKACLIKYI